MNDFTYIVTAFIAGLLSGCTIAAAQSALSAISR